MADRTILFLSDEGFSEEVAAADQVVLGSGGMEITGSGNIQLTGGSGELLGLPATPSGATAATSKAYVDSLIGGIWQSPCEVLRIIDDSLVTAPASPSPGDAYLIAGIGGAWSTFTIGDIVEYDGQSWNVIVDEGGTGEPPDGTRVIVDPTAPAGSFAGQGNAIATYSTGTSTWSFSAPSEGWNVLINGDGGYYENRAYTYDAGTSSWIQIPPSVPWANWIENNKWTASEAISLGDPVYRSGNDTVGLARADTVAKSRLLGIAMEAATSGQYIRIVSFGEAPGVIAGATANDPYYLAATGGTTTTRPVGSGNRVVVAGYAINATDLFYEKTDYGRVA